MRTGDWCLTDGRTRRRHDFLCTVAKDRCGLRTRGMIQNRKSQLCEVESRYLPVGQLGSGGMAEVFLGVQRGAEDFRRLVVIKRIRDSWQEQEDGLRMFMDEARLVASLNHPHIVKLFDLCRMEQDVCLVMEYINGENLSYVRRFCRKHGIQIPLPIICKLMIEAAEALYYAHTARGPDGTPLNLIHRDVGAQNLLLSSSGYLKVIDFGIAKSTTQSELTEPGMFKGKLPYLAPEVFKQRDLDGRLDLYALGLVFYELLTLNQAFSYPVEAPFASVIYRVTSEKLPHVSTVAPHIDPNIDAIIAKATEKDRERRYQSGAELAADIARFAERFAGGVATTAQVAEWFSKTFRKRVIDRREFERVAMRKAEAAGPVEELSQFVTRTEHFQSDLESSNTNSAPRALSFNPEQRGWRYAMFGLAVLGGLGGLAVSQYVTRLVHEWLTPGAPLDESSMDNNNLVVQSIPPGASIWVDGKIIGLAVEPGLPLEIPAGHEANLRFELMGYEDYEMVVEGPSSGQHRIVARLRHAPTRARPRVQGHTKGRTERTRHPRPRRTLDGPSRRHKAAPPKTQRKAKRPIVPETTEHKSPPTTRGPNTAIAQRLTQVHSGTRRSRIKNGARLRSAAAGH